ncbi:glycosyltransferase family 2 protein [Leptospira bandrabouensis]|nr:glycosyltransferase family 2 protein [Leptospira bandrabouensis]MCG6160459.1 glycosyltransferase family 2 protein [Leptospira bandrabouensis]
MKGYFYRLLHKYISLYCLSDNILMEISERKSPLESYFRGNYFNLKKDGLKDIKKADYILLNGSLHYENDIQSYLENLSLHFQPKTRLMIVYYSSLWKPIVKLGTFLGLRSKTAEQNWISHEDMENFLLLSGFELVRNDQKVLLPIYIPLISNLINRYVAPLPLFKNLTLVNLSIAKLVYSEKKSPAKKPSVSIVVAARNEEGNIEEILRRIPKMGPHDELIFIEGHSKDKTWDKICSETKKYRGHLKIKNSQQDGKGKGDAVRKGFQMASNEILMILDADLTVPPEELPKFYKAIVEGKGEYINGSRLVYPMEKRAMRFFNILGNKFFAVAFSFVLGQRFKDTLCGTKVISRENYIQLSKNRKFFGDFDPFGDFDLIFGSARMGLKIVEVPIPYRERVYGDTNISRWRHGAILFAMLIFAARKIKFV